MDKVKEIDAIFKILALYEDVLNNESVVDEDSYLNYLDRLYVKWVGIDCSEIYNNLKGLYNLGLEAGHKRVKSTVFHMINYVKGSDY